MSASNQLSRPERGVSGALLPLIISIFLPRYGASIGALAFSVNDFDGGGWLTAIALLVAAVPIDGPAVHRSQGQTPVALLMEEWLRSPGFGAVELLGSGQVMVTYGGYAAAYVPIGSRFGAVIVLIAGIETAVGGWQAPGGRGPVTGEPNPATPKYKGGLSCSRVRRGAEW